MQDEIFERNLPPYLAHDLDAWKKGVEEKSHLLGEGCVTEQIDFNGYYMFGAES